MARFYSELYKESQWVEIISFHLPRSPFWCAAIWYHHTLGADPSQWNIVSRFQQPITGFVSVAFFHTPPCVYPSRSTFGIIAPIVRSPKIHTPHPKVISAGGVMWDWRVSQVTTRPKFFIPEGTRPWHADSPALLPLFKFRSNAISHVSRLLSDDCWRWRRWWFVVGCPTSN